MRIDKLQVHNFRGFSDTEIVLNGKDAIFYGVNGMGKSSILDVCNLYPVAGFREQNRIQQIPCRRCFGIYSIYEGTPKKRYL